MTAASRQMHPGRAKRDLEPGQAMVGGYGILDGTIEFYGRMRTVLQPTDIVVDVGAGRGAWFFEDRCEARRCARDVRSLVATVIGIDVDPAVMSNPTTTENRLSENGRIPVEDCSANAVLAEYVFEHVEDTKSFSREIDRILRPGGYVFARTPHRLQYSSLVSRMLKGGLNSRVLASAQPNRKLEDAFPTVYALNTIEAIRKVFPGYENYSYLYASEPTYHFGNSVAFSALSFLHRILPRAFVSNIFVFLRKPT